MLAAIFGAFTIVEWILLLVFLIPLAWATGRDRNGVKSIMWEIVIVGFIAYWVYYVFNSPPGDWFPPVHTKAFWAGKLGFMAKYALVGVVYTLFEITFTVFDEKSEVGNEWHQLLLGSPSLQEYVSGQGGVELEAPRDALASFCRRWNGSDHLVKLKMHDLERTPQTTINVYALNMALIPWIILWPAYLTSLLFGRVLDNIFAGIGKLFKLIGNGIIGLVFRNTFKPN